MNSILYTSIYRIKNTHTSTNVMNICEPSHSRHAVDPRTAFIGHSIGHLC